MAIKVTSGFEVKSKSPIDTRLVLTKAQMLAANDKLMPEKYFALCSDDNQIYFYDKAAEPSVETGKYFPLNDADLKERVRVLEEKTDTLENLVSELNQEVLRLDAEKVSKNDFSNLLKVELPGAIKASVEDPEVKPVFEEAMGKAIPGALKNALESQSLTDSGIAVDAEGNIRVELNQEHLAIIDNKIEIALDQIVAFDANVDA